MGITTYKNKLNIVAYGCISDSKINATEINNYDVTNTNVYRKTKKFLSELNLNDVEIYIDIINTHNRKRTKLDILLNENKPNVIILHSLSSFGIGEEIYENYATAIMNNVNLLISDNQGINGISKYSTVDFSLEPIVDEKKYKSHLDYCRSLYQKLKDDDVYSFKTYKGRSEMEISEKFICAYWQYELFKIAEPKAYELAGVSKRTFHKLATKYEQSPEYIKRIQEENQKHDIINKPKRHGKVPDCFSSLIVLTEKGVPLDIACVQNNLPIINEIDFKRYMLKYTGGRKALSKAKEY